MNIHLPRLPLPLDAVIVEANGRARRRRIRLAAAVALVVAGGGATTAGFFATGHYRNQVVAAGPMRVLVASRSIQKGTPASVVLAGGRYAIMTIRSSQVERGAFEDPSGLTGEVALARIYPGEQLTASEFGRATH